MTMIVEPGIYDLADAEYLADPVIEPSLNNSIARLLVDLSPAHAYITHPRLGGADLHEDATDEMRVGTAAHASFLRGTVMAKAVPFDDWRTKAAKEARDVVLAEGLIPLKSRHYDAALRIVDALERFRQTTGAFTAGKPEQSLVWREGPSWCRCKVDWLPDDPAAPIWDLKTTGGTAQAWIRSCFLHGADMQAAWYPRGAECVRGEAPDGVNFCVVEATPPYGIRVFGLSPVAMEYAESKVRLALDRWEDCRRTGSWPNYAFDIEWIDPPVWMVREWEAGQIARRRGMQTIGAATARVVAKMIESGNLAI